MSRQHSIILTLALFCLSIAGTAAAQPRWGRERLPQAGACFYEDINFGGRYFCVHPGERLDSLPNKMGDEISSIRLVGSTQVTVFKDKNLHGRAAHFNHDVRDLRNGGWNDQISSLDIRGGGGGGYPRGEGGGWNGDRPPVWGRATIPREGACFYEDANFHGQYFCVPRGGAYTSLPSGFNDRISSIRVFGGGVQIFKDRDFRGRSSEVRSDLRDLRGSWRDVVSSIRVF